MNKKRLYSYDKGNNKVLCNLNDVCDFNVSNVFQLLNSLVDENEQLRTQLLICQQFKNDDGRFQVWQVPPIPKGMKITTTASGDIK